MLGISRDSAKKHRKFIADQTLTDITLLTDEKGRVAKQYNADHWLLPVSRRVFILVDTDLNILYREDTGFSLLKNQTETLIREIERNLP